MTYEERKKWLCQQCNQKTDCAYVNRKMEYKCLLVEEQMVGWELGYKDAIERACEWLKNNHADIFIRYIRGYDADDEIELLKQYMEKQE